MTTCSPMAMDVILRTPPIWVRLMVSTPNDIHDGQDGVSSNTSGNSSSSSNLSGHSGMILVTWLPGTLLRGTIADFVFGAPGSIPKAAEIGMAGMKAGGRRKILVSG